MKVKDIVSKGYLMQENKDIVSEGSIRSARCIEGRNVVAGGDIVVDIGDVGSQGVIKAGGKISAKHGYLFAKKAIEAKEVEAEYIYSPEVLGKIKKGKRVSLETLNRVLDEGYVPKTKINTPKGVMFV